MSQYINLYQPQFHKQSGPLSARRLVQACVLVFVGLLLVYAYTLWQLAPVKQDIARLQTQQAAATQQLVQQAQQFAPVKKDALLAREIERLSKELASKKAILDLPSVEAFGNNQGFSPYLIGLARQRVEGMWLTGININAGGAELELFGSTLAPDLVPAFLQQLSKEPAFTGREFKTLSLERAETGTAKLNFTLRTSDMMEAKAAVGTE